MPAFLTDTRLILALCILGALVLGVNFGLVSLLRGRRPNNNEAATWTNALGGGRQAQRRQTAELDELHRAVAELKLKAEEPNTLHE